MKHVKLNFLYNAGLGEVNYGYQEIVTEYPMVDCMKRIMEKAISKSMNTDVLIMSVQPIRDFVGY